MKHLGLFEGIGGFSLAARWMGWETIAYSEINPFCLKVLKHHFPEADVLTDIKTTDFKTYANRIDVITGGFPCQPYSVAGKRKGKEDERHLWPEMLRAIREVKPKWVVGENVYGLINWSGGLVFDEVQADLESEGYEVQAYVLPACGINAPHKRYRVWFIAYSEKSDGGLPFGKKEKYSLPGINGTTKPIANPIKERPSKMELQHENTEREMSGGVMQKRVNSGWENWPSESPLCGANDELSDRVASLEGLGNAIVPELCYKIFKSIEQYENLVHNP